MMTFSKTDNSLTVVVLENGKNTVLTTTSSNPNWAAILLALKSQNQNEVVNLMSMTKTIERFSENNVVIKDNNVWFKDRQLHGLDVDRMIQFSKEGIPFLPLAKFLERKAKNPSYRSINELYKFLEHKKMPLTPEGKVLGYKGVRSDNYSVNGNTSTVIISGKTDATGHILNEIGAEIRCDRNCVCDDFKEGCSSGLHIGSLEYASGWGQKVMIVEFDPTDVVCVPEDCNCQKLRTCAYKVVGEYTKPLEDTYNDKFETKPVDENETTEEDEACDCEFCRSQSAGYVTNEGSKDSEETDEYSDGYSQGMADGKGHKARKYHSTDVVSLYEDNCPDYISGYDAGYRFGRYGKE